MIPVSAILGVFYTIVIVHLWKYISDYCFDHDIDNKQREYDNYLSKRFSMQTLLPGADLESISRSEEKQERYNRSMSCLNKEIARLKRRRMWFFVLYLMFLIGLGVIFFWWRLDHAEPHIPGNEVAIVNGLVY